MHERLVDVGKWVVEARGQILGVSMLLAVEADCG